MTNEFKRPVKTDTVFARIVKNDFFKLNIKNFIIKIKKAFKKAFSVSMYDSVDAMHEKIKSISALNVDTIIANNRKRDKKNLLEITKQLRLSDNNIVGSTAAKVMQFFTKTAPVWSACVVIGFLCAVLYYTKNYTIAVKITLDDSVLCYAADESQVEAAISDVEKNISTEIGEEYIFTKDPMLSIQLVSKDSISSNQEISSVFYNKAYEELDQTYGLYIDGVFYCSTVNEEDIYTAVERLKNYFVPSNKAVTAEILNEIEIVKAMYSRTDVVSLDELTSMLTKPKDLTVHTVKKGEKAEGIAKLYGITTAQLKMYNPNSNINKLTVGETLYVSKPLINLDVKVSSTITYTEDIDFTTIKNSTSTLYSGETKVKTAGQKGIKTYTANIVSINGEEVEKKVVGSEITKKPVSKVVLVGTKNVTPNGKFIWPVKGGTITSTFYSSRVGHRHNALDIATKKGTPIYASEAGTVTFSGWKSGGGGYTVIIDHGNNIYTQYSHCSSLYVKVGQKVPQGYTIAAVGSTGNSTGNHVHFVIFKKSGSSIIYVDPLTKLPKR